MYKNMMDFTRFAFLSNDFMWHVSQQRRPHLFVAKKPTKKKNTVDLNGGIALAEQSKNKLFVEELHPIECVGKQLAAGPAGAGHYYSSF